MGSFDTKPGEWVEDMQAMADAIERLTKERDEALALNNRYAWERDKAREERDTAERRSEAFWKEAARTELASRTLAAERERDGAISELTAVSGAIGSVRWMDPPDGGDVSLGEQVSRMRSDLEAAERRARSNWKNAQRLWDRASGWDPDDSDEGPRCRDCADEDGRCPHSGYPCDPQEEAEERIVKLFARATSAEARLEQMSEALTFYRDGFEPKIHKPMPGASNLTWHPSDALLEDCGNRAARALQEDRR